MSDCSSVYARSRLFRARPRRDPTAGTSFASQAANATGRRFVSPAARVSGRYEPGAPSWWTLNQTATGRGFAAPGRPGRASGRSSHEARPSSCGCGRCRPDVVERERGASSARSSLEPRPTRRSHPKLRPSPTARFPQSLNDGSSRPRHIDGAACRSVATDCSACLPFRPHPRAAHRRCRRRRRGSDLERDAAGVYGRKAERGPSTAAPQRPAAPGRDVGGPVEHDPGRCRLRRACDRSRGRELLATRRVDRGPRLARACKRSAAPPARSPRRSGRSPACRPRRGMRNRVRTDHRWPGQRAEPQLS
jgi:hypothetical protein